MIQIPYFRVKFFRDDLISDLLKIFPHFRLSVMSVLNRSSSDKLPDLMIYYINLSRRPDRNVTLLAELNNVQLHAQRIDAIDADTMTAEDMFFLSASEAACWTFITEIQV
jgi:hypothetical protein